MRHLTGMQKKRLKPAGSDYSTILPARRTALKTDKVQSLHLCGDSITRGNSELLDIQTQRIQL